MRGLSLAVVNHGPALSRLNGERLGVAVAGLWHRSHQGKVAPLRAIYPAMFRGSTRQADLSCPPSSDFFRPTSAQLSSHALVLGHLDPTSSADSMKTGRSSPPSLRKIAPKSS